MHFPGVLSLILAATAAALLPSSAAAEPVHQALGRRRLSSHSELARRATSTIKSGDTTWQSQGCVQDGSALLLQGSKQSLSTNTPSVCIARCLSQGYSYAGVEAGYICMCGSSLNTASGLGGALDSSACTASKCKGDSSQSCGGSYKMILYKRLLPTATITSVGTTWTPQGCVQDGSALLLQGSKTSLSANTPSACVDLCRSQGFSYAGLEAGYLCMCGSSLNTASGLGSVLDDPSCMGSSCTGDSAQWCGSSYKMILYKETSASLPSSTITSGSTVWTPQGCVQDGSALLLQGSKNSLSSTNTPSACIATCVSQGYTYAGLEAGYLCMCGASLNTASALGGTLADSECTASACTGDSSAACGGSYRMILYKRTALTLSTATITSGSTTWTPQGCVQDGSALLLQGSKQSFSTNTPSVCIARCLSQGYSYAGVEAGYICMCGSSLNTATGLGSALDSSACTASVCTGDASMPCGGSYKMILYKRSLPTAEITSGSTSWAPQGCVQDGSARLLQGSKTSLSTNTPSVCIARCLSQGYTYAGVEAGYVCMCGSSLNTGSGLGATLDDPVCMTASCTGDSSQSCGGSYRMILYKQIVTTGSCPSAGTAVPTLSAPASSGSKSVFSHHMVGNTYPYTQATWLADIKMARDQGGIDAFALNLGSDQTWQPTQIANAYAAAAQAGSAFKLFFSFDMSVFGCGDIMGSIFNYIQTYGKHSNQFTYDSKIFVSTFSGESCGNNAWQNLKTTLSTQGYPIYFVPGFFDSQDWSSWSSVDGILSWNSAWSMDANDITTAMDTTYINRLSGKSYMPAVSPLFFTHYGANSYNKNWIYQSDDWQFAIRWEQIVAMRDKTDFVEQLTWNDYGESHYIGPIEGAQPNSEAWVDGFEHTAFLAVNDYYAQAFKTGTYPTISCDVVYIMARPHDNAAVATSDSAGPPTLTSTGASNSYLAEVNNFFALIFSTAAATITLTSGSSVKTFTVSSGITRLEAPLQTGSGINVKLVRGSKTFIDYTPDFTFAATTSTYNFNYHVYASDA